MIQGEDHGHSLTQDPCPSDAPAPLGVCPYCGARALRTEEETEGTEVLGETVSVCFACGRSVTSPRWSAASTRRGLLLVLRKVGPYLLLAIVVWLVRPWLPRRTSGAS